MVKIVQIGTWNFVPSKLILWQRKEPENEVVRILSQIPERTEFVSARKLLQGIDWRSIPLNPLQIRRLGICVSGNCQLRCAYCLACSDENKGDGLSSNQICAFIEDFVGKQIAKNMLLCKNEPIAIVFSGGGEPTYDFEKFREIVLYVRSLEERYRVKINLTLVSNGMYDAETVDFLCENFNKIMISYDALPDVHNRNRPSPYYKNTSRVVEDTIKCIVKRSVPLTVRTTVCLADMPLLNKMADHIYREFGTLFSWSIYPVIPRGRGEKLWQDAEYNMDFYDKFLELQKYVRVNYCNAMISSPLFSSKAHDFYCGALGFLNRTAWLETTGEIVTCQEMGEDKTIIGKVENGVISYRKSCIDHLTRISQQCDSDCEGCIAFPFCRGGCPALHRAYKRLNNTAPSWFCRQIQGYWENVISRIVAGDENLGWRLERVEVEGRPVDSIYRMCEV